MTSFLPDAFDGSGLNLVLSSCNGQGRPNVCHFSHQSAALYKHLFHLADCDDDGFISQREGYAFLQRTGLPNEYLKRIWVLATTELGDKQQHQQQTRQGAGYLDHFSQAAPPPAAPPHPQQQQHSNYTATTNSSSTAASGAGVGGWSLDHGPAVASSSPGSFVAPPPPPAPLSYTSSSSSSPHGSPLLGARSPLTPTLSSSSSMSSNPLTPAISASSPSSISLTPPAAGTVPVQEMMTLEQWFIACKLVALVQSKGECSIEALCRLREFREELPSPEFGLAMPTLVASRAGEAAAAAAAAAAAYSHYTANGVDGGGVRGSGSGRSTQSHQHQYSNGVEVVEVGAEMLNGHGEGGPMSAQKQQMMAMMRQQQQQQQEARNHHKHNLHHRRHSSHQPPPPPQPPQQEYFLNSTIYSYQRVDEPPLGHHISYVVSTQTNMPQFSREDFKVTRRFSNFKWLHECFAQVPGILLPPLPSKRSMLPSKRIVRNGTEDFIADRMKWLQRWLTRVCRHSQLRRTYELQVFLEGSPKAMLAAKALLPWDSVGSRLCSTPSQIGTSFIPPLTSTSCSTSAASSPSRALSSNGFSNLSANSSPMGGNGGGSGGGGGGGGGGGSSSGSTPSRHSNRQVTKREDDDPGAAFETLSNGGGDSSNFNGAGDGGGGGGGGGGMLNHGHMNGNGAPAAAAGGGVPVASAMGPRETLVPVNTWSSLAWNYGSSVWGSVKTLAGVTKPVALCMVEADEEYDAAIARLTTLENHLQGAVLTVQNLTTLKRAQAYETSRLGHYLQGWGETDQKFIQGWAARDNGGGGSSGSSLSLRPLHELLTKTGRHLEKEVGKSWYDSVDQEVSEFLDLLLEHAMYGEAVAQVKSQRAMAEQKLQDANASLQRNKQRLQAARAGAMQVQANVAAEKMDAAKRTMDAAQKSMEDVAANFKVEASLYQAERRRELRRGVLEFVRIQVQFAHNTAASWKQVLVEMNPTDAEESASLRRIASRSHIYGSSGGGGGGGDVVDYSIAAKGGSAEEAKEGKHHHNHSKSGGGGGKSGRRKNKKSSDSNDGTASAGNSNNNNNNSNNNNNNSNNNNNNNNNNSNHIKHVSSSGSNLSMTSDIEGDTMNTMNMNGHGGNFTSSNGESKKGGFYSGGIVIVDGVEEDNNDDDEGRDGSGGGGNSIIVENMFGLGSSESGDGDGEDSIMLGQRRRSAYGP